MNKILFRMFALIAILSLFSNAFAGEDKLNAIMNTVSQKLIQLEKTHHVNIGLSAIETYNNTHINFNADKSDTTTSLPMADSMQKLIFGDESKTNVNSIRADAQKYAADDSISEAAVIWRAHASPIVLAVYVKPKNKNARASESIIAEATQIVLNAMSTLP